MHTRKPITKSTPNTPQNRTSLSHISHFLRQNAPLPAASPRLWTPGRTILHLHTESSIVVILEIKILA
ncbi:hypothetical protein MUK42_02636 [Musa troglodytarum]|uniref:Uncharacterized protein n=1 Tax=Musa troglodytarum TaxID=320322 RepID=A0A9E7K1T6_9LILI|nr:hypothetical protein MUK42_02636 [Musa troglodytarum]